MFGVAALFFADSYMLSLLSATLAIILWIDFPNLINVNLEDGLVAQLWQLMA